MVMCNRHYKMLISPLTVVGWTATVIPHMPTVQNEGRLNVLCAQLYLLMFNVNIASWVVCACRDLMEMSVYDELSIQDSEALSQIDDGADIVGTNCHFSHEYSGVFADTYIYIDIL